MRLAALRFQGLALVGAEVERGAVIDRRPARRLRDLALALQFILGLIRWVKQAGALQLLRRPLISVEARRLIGALVPFEAEPGQIIFNALLEFLGGAREIGVVDAQQHLPSLTLREQPVEQCRTDIADMNAPGGRRRETEADGHSFRLVWSGRLWGLRGTSSSAPAVADVLGE